METPCEQEVPEIQPAPETYFATVPTKTMAATPERTLAIAVLMSAINDLVTLRHQRGRQAAKIYNEALEWVRSDDERWTYSFINLCALFDLPADRIRRSLIENPTSVTFDPRAVAA